ncbi:MAG: hypothetical protein ACRYFS_16335 [Janthinobacterium lividum]
MSATTLERFAGGMAADDVLAGARFETLSEDDHAAALERAVKVINRKHARVPQTADALHIFPAVMSTDSVDSHFSRMDETTLKNYSADAGAGVPFMNSHRTGSFSGAELPLGHTYEGSYEDGSAGGGTGAAARKVAKAGIYMLRGLRPNGDAGIATDDMMRAIDGGTVRDGSVGFYGGKSICDICSNDVRDYQNCPHIPGTARKTENNKIATYTVKGAHLREFSGVFSGSTPGAMFSRSALDKTERAIVDKLIGSAEVSYLEDHYRLALTANRTHYSFGKTESDDPNSHDHERKEEDMNAKKLLDAVIVRTGQRLPEEVRKSLETARGSMQDDSTDVEPVLLALERTMVLSAADTDLLAQFRAAGVETVDQARALKADGEDGRAYRKDLIEEALKAGVRAQGEHFSEEVYKKILSAPDRSVADIKAMRDDWDKAAQKRLAGFDADGKPLSEGGRQTQPLHGFENTGNGTSSKKPGSNRNYQTKR